MNKKFLIFGLLGVLAIALVSAAVYYDVFSIFVNIHQPISVSGDLGTTVDCIAGTTCLGTLITISNDGDSEKTILVSNDYLGSDIETSYVSDLVMTRKGLTDWIPTGNPVTIIYTTIDDTFSVSNVPEGFVVVYYPNKNTYDYYDGVVVLSTDVGSTNLPMVSDLNGGDSSDYCTNGKNYELGQCKGAKLWLVPSDAVTSNVINWARASEFYFETELIQFNTAGSLVISPHSDVSFKLKMVVDEHADNWSGEIITTIA